MIHVKLLAFAQAADRLGWREMLVECAPNETLRAIIERIENKPQGLACEANAERVLASLTPADCLPDLPPNAMPRRAAVARSRRRR